VEVVLDQAVGLVGLGVILFSHPSQALGEEEVVIG